MPDRETDSIDAEYWRRAWMWQECGEVATMNEVDTFQESGDLTAPCGRIRNALRELRTFGRQ